MQERLDEDATLRQDRADEDASLRWEREMQSLLIAGILKVEREKTDGCMRVERGLADNAVIHRDDLMGMVSHDLQNLLAGLSIQASVLARQAADSEEGQRTLLRVDRIERSVACMHRLIGDLVDVTSLDAGKFAVRPQTGCVIEMITEAIAPLVQSAQDHGLSLEFTPAWEDLLGVFDWQRMMQVVANLFSNAMKFTPSGGVITFQAAPDGDNLRVTVLDTGEGIAPEMREAIFERFKQAEGTTHSGLGLGLGLYISRCIVEAQGGRIWAESNPAGTGSAFHLTIPRPGNAPGVTAV